MTIASIGLSAAIYEFVGGPEQAAAHDHRPGEEPAGGRRVAVIGVVVLALIDHFGPGFVL